MAPTTVNSYQLFLRRKPNYPKSVLVRHLRFMSNNRYAGDEHVQRMHRPRPFKCTLTNRKDHSLDDQAVHGRDGSYLEILDSAAGIES